MIVMVAVVANLAQIVLQSLLSGNLVWPLDLFFLLCTQNRKKMCAMLYKWRKKLIVSGKLRSSIWGL